MTAGSIHVHSCVICLGCNQQYLVVVATGNIVTRKRNIPVLINCKHRPSPPDRRTCARGSHPCGRCARPRVSTYTMPRCHLHGPSHKWRDRMRTASRTRLRHGTLDCRTAAMARAHCRIPERALRDTQGQTSRYTAPSVRIVRMYMYYVV